MSARLTWDQIGVLYDKQWIELVNYQWPDVSPYPSAGEVRIHSGDRKEFYRKVKLNPVADSAILFVGKLDIPLSTVTCSSSMLLSTCK